MFWIERREMSSISQLKQQTALKISLYRAQVKFRSVYQKVISLLIPVNVQVRIHLRDLNDNIPIFNTTGNNENIQVPETTRVGEKLVKLTAHDRDVGDNGKVIYRITSGDDGCLIFYNHIRIIINCYCLRWSI